MCGLAASSRCGRQAWAHRKVPRELTCCIRSKRFIGVSSVPRSQIALALLTRTSSPPNPATVAATASRTCCSSRMSHWMGSARPPACSTSSATVWMVPGSLGLGTPDLATMAMLAPSRAARRAIWRPIPREAPVMKRVLPASVVILLSTHAPPSRLRALAFVVFPFEDPPGDEAVHRLAGAEPHVAHPRMALEHAPFHRGEVFAAIHALVLEQVSQVLARQQPHPARARVADHGQLEIDDPGASALQHQPVGLLGQVVVGHATAVQLLQPAPGRAEVREVA